MTIDAPPDYTATIRAEIERDVLALKQRLERSYPMDDCPTHEAGARAQYVELGYLVNSHRGQAIYVEGDLIAGLPVRLARCGWGMYQNERAIAVCANEVEFTRYGGDEGFDEDGRTVLRDRTYTKDLREEVQW